MDCVPCPRLLFAVVLLSLLLTTPVARAQGVGSSGEITGTVTDPTGAVMPKVAVTVLNPATGLRRETVTNAMGQFAFPGLQPAAYDVSAKMSGFATDVRKELVVRIGETAICNFSLRLEAQTVIEVTGEAPVVETKKGSVGNTISLDQITNLPIDRRDYLTFTLLAPGVSDSSRLAGDQDFRVKQTPQSGLSFYGSNGRGNSITVDGGETSGDSGGVRTTVSQEAVQEFQVNRSNFGAQLGSATGASINIVTKSGTNTPHGSLFGFFRNQGMDAANPFSFSQALKPGETFNPLQPDLSGTNIKDSLSRQQYGGSIGFPIKKDKTFAFAAFEGVRQDVQNAVPLLVSTSVFRPTDTQNSVIGGLATLAGNPNVPCIRNPDGTFVLQPAQTCAFILNDALTVNPKAAPIPGLVDPARNLFLQNQFETQGGVFPFSTRQYLTSGRVDHHLGANDQISVTYRYGHDVEQSPDVHSLTAFSAGSEIKSVDNTVQGAWYHQFSSSTQNEVRIQYNHYKFDVLPNEPGEIGLQIPGYINNLGANIFLPNLTTLKRSEFADNVSVIRGRHSLEFGASELLRGNDTASHTFMPGRFVFGTLPGGAVFPCLSVPAACGLSAALPSSVLTSLQSASLGLPQVYQQGFGDPHYPYYSRPLTAAYFRDRWAITTGFTLNYGLRYELDTQFLPLTTYKKDFAPRVSFAWDPFKNNKTVIRGGYGIFYSPIDVQIPDVDLSLGVVNGNKSGTANNGSKPTQVGSLLATCGVSILGPTGDIPIIPGSGASPCNREISIYIDPISATGIPGLQTAPVVFQSLFATPSPTPNTNGGGLIGCTTPAAGNLACVTPAAVAPLGIRVANTGALSPLQVVFTNQRGYRPPIAQQASMEIEREISRGFSVSVGGVYVHTQRLPVAIDTNLTQAPLLAPTSTVTLANGKPVTYRNWNTDPNADPLGGTEISARESLWVNGVFTPNQVAYPCQPPGDPNSPTKTNPPSPCFVSQLVVQSNQYSSAASAVYEGLLLELKKRFSGSFSLFANYTFAKGFDNSTDYNTDYGPQDPTNLKLDRSLSEFDERHKVVISGIIDSPWKSAFVSGFELAPIFTYHSGHPFNLLAGGEVNGNNHTTNERPIGAPRDTGLGPDYYDLDMRLGWKHKIGDKAQLQFTAEGFNIANRTNFASVNNEVSPLFGFVGENGVPFTTFNVRGIRPGTVLNGKTVTPSTPLSFTSALAKRQVQLGVRLSF